MHKLTFFIFCIITSQSHAIFSRLSTIERHGLKQFTLVPSRSISSTARLLLPCRCESPSEYEDRLKRDDLYNKRLKRFEMGKLACDQRLLTDAFALYSRSLETNILSGKSGVNLFFNNVEKVPSPHPEYKMLNVFAHFALSGASDKTIREFAFTWMILGQGNELTRDAGADGGMLQDCHLHNKLKDYAENLRSAFWPYSDEGHLLYMQWFEQTKDPLTVALRESTRLYDQYDIVEKKLKDLHKFQHQTLAVLSVFELLERKVIHYGDLVKTEGSYFSELCKKYPFGPMFVEDNRKRLVASSFDDTKDRTNQIIQLL